MDPQNLGTIGRILMGAAFVYTGYRNVLGATRLTEIMTTRGVPMAQVVLALGIAVQCVAGALFAAGFARPFAATALMLFVILATLMFYNFWNYPAGPERGAKLNGFLANVALVGAFMMVIAGDI